MTGIIEFDSVSFGYRHDKLALDHVSLSLPRGARIAFVGPNGAGKSTLFLHLNAILQPIAGRLQYDGIPYEYTRKAIASLRQKVGLVFQDQDAQLFAGSVLDDVLFGPMNLGMSLAEGEKIARESLDAVGMLDYAGDPVHFLSHGQKKRVAIAGVLAMGPEVMVMDEPTAGLDYSGIETLSEIMEQLYRQGKTLVVATHDINWAWAWADMVFVLVKGQVAAAGCPEEILVRPDHRELGFAQPLVGAILNEFRKDHPLVCGERQHLPRSAAELVQWLQASGIGAKDA